MLADWDTGKGYIGMLVKLTNVSIASWKDDGKGRITGAMATGSNAPAMSNELMDLGQSVQARSTFKSVTGVVTYFFSLKVAPRSSADLAY